MEQDLPSFKRLVFDIETDGFLQECTQLWLVMFECLDTGRMINFLPGQMGWQDVMNNATLLVGHNVLGFDFPALTKLTGYVLPKSVKVHDTLIMSQALDYRRFGHDGHSLARWGEYFDYPKLPSPDFSVYADEMLVYGVRDVNLNTKVYLELRHELAQIREKAALAPLYLRAEQAVSKWCADASLYGWPFDIEAAAKLLGDLQTSMDIAYSALVPRLGRKAVAKDKRLGVVEAKKPKWTMKGCYDHHTAKWFDIDPWSGYEGEERMVEGPYSRVEFKDLSLDSVADVKVFLFRNGWVPLEYNTKRNPEGRGLIQTSPKITEESLEFLGGDGKLYKDFLITKSRFGILKSWVAGATTEGRLHGDAMTVGTPSMRMRHSIIANVPSTDSAWGPEMRSLFVAKAGWKVVGADSSGNQVRGLAHYLGDEEFIETLLHGDIHQYNADLLTKIISEEFGMPDIVSRSASKRILYAFLFGASGGKLWSYLFGTPDVKKGNKLKNRFVAAVPGFKHLLDKLNRIYGSTSKQGYGYIPSIAGMRIYVDSPHKLLVYLLQSAEKATCSAALMMTMDRLEEEGIPYQPLIFMHDELQFMTPAEFSERAGEIAREAFKEGPKLFNVNIMDGESKIGDNWLDTH